MKLGMTSISPRTPSCRLVASARLCETAVTPSDCSMEYATISEYRRIAPDQRDVRPVQRRHDLGHGSGSRRREHLRRQKRDCRVRDRVVRVNDAEPELARHLHEPIGQRQHVLRLAEQRIARRLDLVKRQARMELGQPERQIRADEVHLVAAVRERLPQLGGDDAAAADRGVAEEADVQGF